MQTLGVPNTQPKFSLLIDDSQTLTYLELFKQAVTLALIDVQTLSASNYQEFRNVFVTQTKAVSEPQFEEIVSLVDFIPGATTSQMMVALGTISKKNALGGITALVAYTVPGALILTILGYWYGKYPDPRDLNILVFLAIQGIKSSTVALILQLLISMAAKSINNKMHIALSVLSAALFVAYQQPYVLILTMMMGGIITIMVEYDAENTIGRRTFVKEYTATPAVINDPKLINKKNSHKISQLFGNKSFHLYSVILLLLLYLNSQYQSMILDLSLSFYNIGTFMIGGTPITLPFMYAETVLNPLYINADAFWLGFGLAAALPGPYLNFAIFLGTHSMGIYGGVSCWVAIFVPSVLQIWGLLPHWSNFRKNIYLAKFKEGVISVAIGFLATAVYYGWVDACKYDLSTATVISFLSLVYVSLLNFNSPAVLTLGAALFIIRYLALWYYRELDPVIF
ncbi:unnamed protein product (macronuclear) [Paramecium tetraurelia]|uniref:Chromate transporter n=1 Tax=Paramecium tetraurelia TaxID=5888 RepID=A0BTM8_PARTE|nr:uncharacterized protein GSPATT00032127001 [Paramecium tetraurelia]CAK61895.1 unnamed protein product [Paramecium tetraurelia]|eukprot:XP_001429293.1 hypothetical protein (macronuclear) [Paramecium tetraurelia strain d4-2]